MITGKALERVSSGKRESAMSDNRYSGLPVVNLTIIAINFMYFGYLEMIGDTENTMFMIAHGALYLPAVQQGEYWRLLTAVFMHFGIGHIINNMLVLYVLGDNLERALGSIRYLVLYLVCGIGANCVSLWYDQTAALQQTAISVSAGASGAVFGVVGGLLYAVSINRGRLEDLSARQLAVMILFSLYFGFTSTGVNNAAHIAGLVIGVIMGLILYRKPRKNNRFN